MAGPQLRRLSHGLAVTLAGATGSAASHLIRAPHTLFCCPGTVPAGPGLKIFHTDHFVLPLPSGHRFPMAKYSSLRRRVVDAALVSPEDLRVPHAATPEELLRAHAPEYVERVTYGRLSEREMRTIGLPWSPALVHRSRRSCGATIEACRAALEDGVSVSLAGGTHHAFRDRGEGSCVFNDSAIAARAMQAEGRSARVVVIDCDVHQGNGTASIMADDRSVFTFSIHGQRNFPTRKARSDLDIGLPDATGDEVYLAALEQGLRRGAGNGRRRPGHLSRRGRFLLGRQPWSAFPHQGGPASPG